MERHFLTLKQLKELCWDTKLTPKQWNAAFNKTEAYLTDMANMTPAEMGLNEAKKEDRISAAIFRSSARFMGFGMGMIASMTGGRRQISDEEIRAFENPRQVSPINIQANRIADELRDRTRFIQHHRKALVMEPRLGRNGLARSIYRMGAVEASMILAGVQALTMTSELVADTTAKLTGGRKWHRYSLEIHKARAQDARIANTQRIQQAASST